jgi:hypothetical protein
MVSGLTFTHDGRKLAAAVEGGLEQQWVSWDLTAAVPEPKPTQLARCAILAPGGRVAVRPNSFGGGYAPAEFVDPTSGERISRFDPPEQAITLSISRTEFRRGLFSGDGRRFIALRRPKPSPSAQEALGLAVWDVATGKRIAQRQDGNTVAGVAAVSPDGKAVAVLPFRRDGPPGSGPVQLALWEPDTGRTRWACGLDSHMPFITFTRGGSWLVVQELGIPTVPDSFGPPGGEIGPMVVRDTATGKELRTVNGPPLGKPPLLYADESFYPVPHARAVSPNGRMAAFTGFDGTIYLWELVTDQERCRIRHPGPVHDLAFSPDGRLLAAASRAAPVIVYDLYGTRRK